MASARTFELSSVILQLAATEGEARVRAVLSQVLDQVGGFDYVTVQAQVAPPVFAVPVIHIPVPDLSLYDAPARGGCMSYAATTQSVGLTTTLLLPFPTLTTAAREMVSRFVQAEQQPALPLLLDVLELEAQERHERRITRLRRASKLPPGKTFDTLEEGRLPPALVRRLRELADGDFLEDATNVLAFGLPGVGKSHAICAVGHALVDRGHPVLFMPTYSLVRELVGGEAEFDPATGVAEARSLRGAHPRRRGLHPAESRGGRDSLHAPRRTLRATLRLHHEQFDLRALGSDLPRSDGDRRGDRSVGASLGPAGI